jgi:endonuclease III
MPATFFIEIIKKLEKYYGVPDRPVLTGLLELILRENVAYLVNDEKREKAFAALKERIGLKPTDILSAPDEKLLEVARLGGIMPELRVTKLRDIAQTVISDFDGDLDKILMLPPAQAKKALRKFPGIGDPGAEMILLFSGVIALPGLESNGLRVVTRLGLSEEKKSYSATYRAAQEAILSQSEPNTDLFIKAYQLLRRHGQELCKRNDPTCEKCPLRQKCRYFLLGARMARPQM